MRDEELDSLIQLIETLQHNRLLVIREAPDVIEPLTFATEAPSLDTPTPLWLIQLTNDYRDLIEKYSLMSNAKHQLSLIHDKPQLKTFP